MYIFVLYQKPTDELSWANAMWNDVKGVKKCRDCVCVFCVLYQKPTDELGKCYVNFMRASLDQIRQKIIDELYILSILEVGFSKICVVEVSCPSKNDAVDSYVQPVVLVYSIFPTDTFTVSFFSYSFTSKTYLCQNLNKKCNAVVLETIPSYIECKNWHWTSHLGSIYFINYCQEKNGKMVSIFMTGRYAMRYID